MISSYQDFRPELMEIRQEFIERYEVYENKLDNNEMRRDQISTVRGNR